MKNKILIVAAVALLAACGGNRTPKLQTEEVAEVVDMHNAANSLDYAGVYKGTLPAADCPGIEVTLTLNADGTYAEHNKYIDRNSEFDEQGTYAVEGNRLTLNRGEGQIFSYQIEEGRLRQLDGDNQLITGPLADSFILTKTK